MVALTKREQDLRVALEMAVRSEDAVAVARYIEEGADPSGMIQSGEASLLHMAALQLLKGALIARVLIEEGAKIEARTVTGSHAPLHYAASRGSADAVTVLLGAGADIESKDSVARTPLHCAAEQGNIATLAALLDFGVDADQCDEERRFTALMHAAYGGHRRVCEVLLDRGAVVGACAPQMGTALHIAAKRGFVEVCRVLVERGASLHLAVPLFSAQVRNAVQVAAQEGQLDVMRFFLFECQSDPFVLTGDGKSLADLADDTRVCLAVLAAQTEWTIARELGGGVDGSSGGRAHRTLPSL
jgi:hypothetical protein